MLYWEEFGEVDGDSWIDLQLLEGGGRGVDGVVDQEPYSLLRAGLEALHSRPPRHQSNHCRAPNPHHHLRHRLRPRPRLPRPHHQNPPSRPRLPPIRPHSRTHHLPIRKMPHNRPKNLPQSLPCHRHEKKTSRMEGEKIRWNLRFGGFGEVVWRVW